MSIIIRIDIDSAAFEDNCGPEIRRILYGLSQKLCDNEPVDWQDYPLHDINGNPVGNFRFGN